MTIISLKNAVEFLTKEPAEYERHKPYYILYSDGVYRHTLRDAVLVKEKFSELSKPIPLLPKGETDIFLQIPKIPFNVWLRVVDFFKSVYAQDKTEASCHIFYLGGDELIIPQEYDKYRVGVLQLGDWMLYCPQQTNSGALTSFREDELYLYLRKHYRLAMECHSHHTMGAFWSTTDNKNQQDPVLYGVLGEIHKSDKFLVKFVLNGVNITIDEKDVIEYPKIIKQVESDYTDVIDIPSEEEVYIGPFKQRNEFPKEWLTECHKVHATTYQNIFGTKGYEEDFSEFDDFENYNEVSEEGTITEEIEKEILENETQDTIKLNAYSSATESSKEIQMNNKKQNRSHKKEKHNYNQYKYKRNRFFH